MSIFFANMPDANTLAAAVAAPVPQFLACLCDVMVGNVLWPRMLPQCYHSVTLPKVLDSKTDPKLDNPNSKKKSAQVRNLIMSLHFKDFDNIIKKVGPPPAVTHDGKDIPTCVSHHLHGTCFKGFQRVSKDATTRPTTVPDAGPGSTDPDELLSHEQNSAHMNGYDRICVLAIPHGNQYAAMFDAMPADNKFLHGVWTVMTFDFSWI